MKKLILLILVIEIGGLILFSNVNAQEGKGIGISPLIFELAANPGDVLENQLKVYNPSNSTIGIKMEIEDFKASGELGHVALEPAETETYSIARWITSEPKEFVLGPAEQKFVKFTISVPQNAEPGGHYGSILAGTTAVVGGEFMGAAVAGRVGALVLLTVSGEMKEELAIKEFSIPYYSEKGPINFIIRFENKGTVHVKPVGFVTITNFFGKKVVDLELPQRNVIPNSIRRIETTWNQKWLWGGKYTATLNGSYGASNIPLTPVVITFWAFPWKVGLGILVFIILLILSRKRWVAALKVLIKGEKVIPQ